MTLPFRQDSSIKDLGGSDISDNELSNSLDILPDMGYGKRDLYFLLSAKTKMFNSFCTRNWLWCILILLLSG